MHVLAPPYFCSLWLLTFSLSKAPHQVCRSQLFSLQCALLSLVLC